jgi:RNA polymerase sigma factor (sigma-70 family)
VGSYGATNMRKASSQPRHAPRLEPAASARWPSGSAGMPSQQVPSGAGLHSTGAPANRWIERAVHHAARGDPHAWDSLYRAFSPTVMRVARNHRLASQDAQDVVQEVFLSLYRNLHELNAPHAIAGWLATSARRTALRRLVESGHEIPVGLVPAMPHAAAAFADELIDELALREALGVLPDGQRAGLERMLAGRSEREIADELGVSRSSVRGLVSRAASTVYEAVAPEDAARRRHERDAVSDHAVLFGRVIAVDDEHVSVIAGEQRDGLEMVAHLPLFALSPPDRARLREGSLLRWSLSRWRDPTGALLARSEIRVEPEGQFSPAQQRRIAERTAELNAQFAGFHARADA